MPARDAPRRRPTPDDPPLRLLIDLLFAAVVALLVGVLSAWYAVDRSRAFGSLSIGEWTAWPSAGRPDIDPYSAAMLVRTGEIPLGASEGLAFTAKTDSGGTPLTGRCSYLVVGQTPGARVWTLTAYDGEGHLMANPAERPSFQSRQIVRRPDGRFEIAVARTPAPGNWLPIGTNEAFSLVLRLYDSALASEAAVGDQTMPRIIRGACR